MYALLSQILVLHHNDGMHLLMPAYTHHFIFFFAHWDVHLWRPWRCPSASFCASRAWRERCAGTLILKHIHIPEPHVSKSICARTCDPRPPRVHIPSCQTHIYTREYTTGIGGSRPNSRMGQRGLTRRAQAGSGGALNSSSLHGSLTMIKMESEGRTPAQTSTKGPITHLTFHNGIFAHCIDACGYCPGRWKHVMPAEQHTPDLPQWGVCSMY